MRLYSYILIQRLTVEKEVLVQVEVLGIGEVQQIGVVVIV